MSTVYRKHPLTAGRIVDGVAFVVTADDNRMHTLNSTASHAWEQCKDGATLEQAAIALTKKFDVDLNTARRDLNECFQDLIKRDILVAE